MSKKYILFTAARNEQEFIANTIEAVKRQTLQPIQWYICLNGSNDKTESIVLQYKKVLPFISIVNIMDNAKPAFSRKAYAIMYAYKQAKIDGIDFIGVLDADVTFEENFYESLVEKFQRDTVLGLATGDLIEVQKDGKYKLIRQPREYTVSGNAQFFRKKCFEDIDGYREVETGGIDTIAAVMARMYGWKTRTFEDICCYHHRMMGTKYTSIRMANYKEGFRDSKLGMHTLYALAKILYRLKRKPYFTGSFFWMIGYLLGSITGKEKLISKRFRLFLHKEQLKYLKSMFINKSALKRSH